MKRFSIITLFPEMFDGFIKSSIIGKAIAKQKIAIEVVDLRQFSTLKYHQVDDYQFGGGEGMVLMAPIVVAAIESVKTDDSVVILLSPQGKTFDNASAHQYANDDRHIVLICGHYEGFDERIRAYVDFELSIGDYVITGGELASMVVVDAIARLTNDVIRSDSHENDSFNNGLLDYPVYTKPLVYRDQAVPEVLLSGHHANIKKWRMYQALKNTYLKRPDLLTNSALDKTQQAMLETIEHEFKNSTRDQDDSQLDRH